MLINITDDIVRLHKAGILDRLLCDKTTGRNLLWATDAYAELGQRYERNEEIAPELIAGASLGVIKTRARKAFEQQTERTRHRAEVFTPLWVVRKMCDTLDEAWFGYPDVFFKDGAPTERVRFFENKHTWRDYVDSRRMEITCGEGPFLVSRYDAATGEIIPVAERVGVLDRKLRVVSENAETEAEWLTWALRAFQASYGYEWAGDNLLIARVNLLASFGEHFQARWGHAPQPREEKKLANVIAWNLWQMDGLTYTVPYRRAPDDQISLFDLDENAQSPPLCLSFDWRARRNVELKGAGAKMKFDFIIGNPPYQDETLGENKGFAPPIYDKFMEEAYKVADKVELIHPARFLFNAGSTPKAWNQKMLADPHLKILHYEQDASTVFPNTDIKGGIVISYHDKLNNYGAIGVFTKYPELNTIIKKAKPTSEENSIMQIIFIQNRFNLSSLYADYPEVKTAIGSNGKDSRFEKNIFVKVPIFFEEATTGTIKVMGIYFNKRVWRYISQKYVDMCHENLTNYKVVLPVANGSGEFGQALSSPFVEKPMEAYTRSFIGIGSFSTEGEANAALKYIKSKFSRAMLSVLKVTQMCNKDVWAYVPLQDFTPTSDIDWSKSIPEIDRQLYAKYGLDQSEIDFIEFHVKEMT